jgi:RecB family exonuclease
MTSDEPIIISFSEIDAFRQCPFKHKLAYKLRYSRESEPMSALGKGGSWHTVLELHYRSIRMAREDGKSEAIGLYNAKNAVELYIDSLENEELQTLMWWMYRGYVQVYGSDDQWHVQAVENTIVVPLEWSNGEPTRFQLKVKIDLVVVDAKGRWWIDDHKSCGQLPKDDDFEFEEQFKLYAAVMRKIGYPIHGCVHDAALTKMNKGDYIFPGDPLYKATMKATPLANRFKRTLIAHTDKELTATIDDVIRTATLMYSEENLEERHPDGDKCRWRCSFTEACLYGRRQDNDAVTYNMLADTGFTQSFERH